MKYLISEKELMEIVRVAQDYPKAEFCIEPMNDGIDIKDEFLSCVFYADNDVQVSGFWELPYGDGKYDEEEIKEATNMNNTFIDDEEKMRDFVDMSKEDFLEFYSYLTEEEYELTKRMWLENYYIHKEAKRDIKQIFSVLDSYSTTNDYIETYKKAKEILNDVIKRLEH